MRILLVITELDEGGAENALVEVAHGLRAAGDIVEVVALFHGDTPPAARLRTSHIPVTDLRLRPAIIWTAPFRLRRVIRRFRPDLVHSWLFHANFASRLGAPRGMPLICGLRVVEPRHGHIWADRVTRNRVAGYVCVSAAVAEFARQRIGAQPDRIRVIGNGVYRPAGAIPDRDRTRLRGLTVARVTPQKGLDSLLAALARLPADLDWTWRIAGAAPDLAYAVRLRENAAGTGIEDRLQWLGPVPREQMSALYQEANLFVLPSRWEGQPNALLEALAWRLPSIATAVDGVRDLDREVSGCFEMVPSEAPDALATAIQRTFCASPDPGGEQAERLERLLANHDWTVVCRAYREFYREILASGPPAK